MGAGLIAMIVVVLVVPVVGTIAVFGIYAVRRYVADIKLAEARDTLGSIAYDARAAYDSEGDLGADGTWKKRICPSASAAVPADRSLVSGRKYASAPSEWRADAGSRVGFACLHFEKSAPQYFQYEYEATPTSFVARAHGDLNGDGVFSTFEVKGQVVGDRVVISPSTFEVTPYE